MTPIYKTPAHVDRYAYGNEGDVEEHYSRCFHRDHPGRIVAEFYGPNHRQDAEEFCKWASSLNGESEAGTQPTPTKSKQSEQNEVK